MRIYKLLFLLGILLLARPTDAQRFEMGFMAGACNYQGDLTPGTARISFGNPHPAFGVHLGYEINDIVTVRGKITLTSMSGYDNQANATWRLQRNLHFKSSLQEAGINVEIYGLNVFKFMSNLAFHPYLVTGFNVFRYNPKAQYGTGENQAWIPLQPLGTEGQGVYEDRKKYNLTEFSIPWGFGIRYTFNNYFSMSMDLTQRWTFTDYLDDVSKTYIPLDMLLSANGETAANLAYRGGELGFDQEITAQTPRGNPKENDWYVITNVTFIAKFAPIWDKLSEKKAKCYKGF